ncbi:MAG TPA: hypothetical protein VMQ58_00315 [Candidatus Saccharimonadales bacterium]|nr:hypothetical protein [Candidatus Saccharimonadales bacterium]
MNNIAAMRKEIKSQFPNLQFKIMTISFEDLARSRKVFIESNEWGMAKGNQETYNAVKTIADKYNAIVSW